MNCPHCGSDSSYVIDSRHRVLGEIPIVYRRRRCKDCQESYSTYELAAENVELEEDD